MFNVIYFLWNPGYSILYFSKHNLEKQFSSLDSQRVHGTHIKREASLLYAKHFT